MKQLGSPMNLVKGTQFAEFKAKETENEGENSQNG